MDYKKYCIGEREIKAVVVRGEESFELKHNDLNMLRDMIQGECLKRLWTDEAIVQYHHKIQ